MPVGARLLVKDIIPKDSVVERAKRAGIHAVVFDRNLPKITTGIVVALGSDPEMCRLIKKGDTVFFSNYAGTHTMVEGEQYRTIEFREITNVLRDVSDPTPLPPTTENLISDRTQHECDSTLEPHQTREGGDASPDAGKSVLELTEGDPAS